MKTYKAEKCAITTCSDRNYTPVFFGHEHENIYLFDDFFCEPGNVVKKGDKYMATEDFEINNGEEYFKLKEIEVYKVEYKELA